MNDTEKLIQEKKQQLEEIRQLCLEYPKAENYTKLFIGLQQEIADLAEGLYKCKTIN